MKGKVLDFNIQSNTGIITASDNNRYMFTNKEWKSSSDFPTQGQDVDFVVDNKNAIEIYVSNSKKYYTTVNTIETSAAAVTSMIFGILGLFFDWIALGLPSIIAIITGHIAKTNIRRSNGKLSGDGMATAGLILGYLVIVLYLLVTFVFVGVFASLMNT